MLSLVLYAFTRSPFDKVSFHAMDTLSSRDREQSKKMCLSQHVLDLILLKQHTDRILLDYWLHGHRNAHRYTKSHQHCAWSYWLHRYHAYPTYQ
jgi:hypothetical protein